MKKKVKIISLIVVNILVGLLLIPVDYYGYRSLVINKVAIGFFIAEACIIVVVFLVNKIVRR